MVIAPVSEMPPCQAQQRARTFIERAAHGKNPAKGTRRRPGCSKIFEAYIYADEGRAPRTIQTYQYQTYR